MVSGNAENKSAFENGIFLKVDSIEPVLKGGGICSRKTYLDGVKVWIGNYGYFFPCDRYIVCDPDAVREDGRRQALDLVRKIYDMTGSERREAFDKAMLGEIIRDADYDELTKKLDNWKKEQETIRVRDEVYHESMQVKFVVTKIFSPSGNEDAIVNGIKRDGTTVKGLLLHNVKKTGLHVDDLDAYLEV